MGAGATTRRSARDRALQVLLACQDGTRFGGQLLDELQTRDPLSDRDASLAAELVIGVGRHRISAEHIASRFYRGRWLGLREPIRLIFALGVYQLCWLDRIPDHAAIDQAVRQARRHGILSLQRSLHRLEDHPFLFRSLRLAVDGLPAEQIEQVLSSEAQAMSSRHLRSAGVLRRAGEVAPAMGLIGTLIGLVQMLGNLEDPESIGPAMAVALLTTFYGAVLANMVFLPLASKLERNSGVEALVNQIFAMGVVSIARQENPRRLEILLNTVLPPELRVGDFD